MTMASAMTELDKLEGRRWQRLRTRPPALLRGARGRSGVILSLLFRGMAKKVARGGAGGRACAGARAA